jgi:serine/threonine-protein phosphatase 5
MYGWALADASKAISLDAAYVKGYYRRAGAYMALSKFKFALKDLEQVVKVRPNDSDAKLKYNECKKIVQRQAFEKAIAVDDKQKSVCASINVEAIRK